MEKSILAMIMAIVLTGCGSDSEPVIEPVVEPVIEPVVEPVIEPVVEPIVDFNWVSIGAFAGNNTTEKVDDNGDFMPYIPVNDHTIPLDPEKHNVRVSNQYGIQEYSSFNDKLNVYRVLRGNQSIDSPIFIQLTSAYRDTTHPDLTKQEGWTVAVNFTKVGGVEGNVDELSVTYSELRPYDLTKNGYNSEVILSCKYEVSANYDGKCTYYDSEYNIGHDFDENLKILDAMRLNTSDLDWAVLVQNEFLKYMGVL